MENTIYLGLARQVALSNNMDVVANNVANINTPGYRAQNLLFAEHVFAPKGAAKGDERSISFVYDKGEYKNTQEGSLHTTGNPLNVAMEGPGFLGVIGPGGKTFYSRAGNFTEDATGTLLTATGHPVAGNGGSQIVIPKESTEIKIDENGVISNQNGQIGQLEVTEFDDPQTLKPFGDNLYEATSDPGKPATQTRVVQGELETSNVQAVLEMTHMIKTLRDFQSMQQILDTENDRLRSAVEQLTRQS